MKVEVYGSSDDLIEIDGDLQEEFNVDAGDDQPQWLAFSDGTILRVQYCEDAIWRISRAVAGSAKYSKHEATNVDSDYSDRVTLEGAGLVGVVCGQNAAFKRGTVPE